ncbi:UNVERIFIED_CONTAM: hypothetical protein FKN15_017720 [Acipenser sinensis]
MKEVIYKPLTKIMQQSLDTGVVPTDWKIANVIPIHKKGDKTEPGNYRPISLTSIICKLMETIIRSKMENYLYGNNILGDSQHGFRKGRSCLTNLLDFFEDAKEKGTPLTAPPARQGGKAARKTKHLIPTEGEERSAAGGELPVAVTKGAREEPLKEQPPRASLSGGGEGSVPCAAVGGETSPEAVPVTDAEGGEGPERVYPLSLGEGGEGPERVDPLPSRKEDGPETVPRTSKEGPRAGTTRPSGSAAYVERPSAPPKSRVQTVPARVPPPISPAASPGGGALGESVKIKIRRNALTQQRECVVLLHREGGGGEPEEREEDSESTCSVGSESLSAPSPDIPAADLLEFLEATVHRRDKVQLALDKWGDFQRILTSVRSFLRASHANKTSGSNVHIRARKLHDQLVSFGRTQDLP